MRNGLLLGLVMAAAWGSAPPATRQAAPMAVTLPLTYILEGTEMDLHVPLQIGNNLLLLALDTGSVGIRALAASLPDMSNIVVSNESTSYGYNDGVKLDGFVATATVAFANVSSTIDFMLIESVGCVATIPDCPAAQFMASGRGGVMGVRLSDNLSNFSPNGSSIWNPLAQLPDGYANGFIIAGTESNPELTIGLTAANTQGFTMINLLPESVPANEQFLAPYPLWRVLLNGQYSLPSFPFSNVSKFIFDSGTDNTQISDSTFPRVLLIQDIVMPGNILTFNLEGLSYTQFSWQFMSGTTPRLNLVNVNTSNNSQNIINSGSSAFKTYDILYNINLGLIGFRLHSDSFAP